MMRRGITLVEVVACLLMVSLGVISVLGLVMYGNELSSRAQAASTAAATANTVLYDSACPGIADRSVSGGVVTGYLNGYFFRRTEAADALAASSPLRANTVTVELFLGARGTRVFTYRQRLLEGVP